MASLKLRGVALLAILVSGCSGEGTAPPTAKSGMQSSAKLALSVTPVAMTMPADYSTVVQQIYVAYFGRPADPGGKTFFSEYLAQTGAPTNLSELAQSYQSSDAVRLTVDSFGVSQESQELYAGDNETFVTAIYRNLFNRAPEAEGKAYWVSVLDQKLVTRGNAAITIMAAARGNDIASVQNKIAVAQAFTNLLTTPDRQAAYSGNVPSAKMREVLGMVTPDSDLQVHVGALDRALDSLLTLSMTASGRPVVLSAPIRLAGRGLATLFEGRAYLSFIAAATPSGSEAQSPSHYIATCTAGAEVRTGHAHASPVLVEGLQQGVQYNCNVKGASSAGVSPATPDVLVTTPTGNPSRLRFIYAIPTDRVFVDGWATGVARAAASLQDWYAAQLGGRTFTLQSSRPEICRLPRDSAAYFSNNTWAIVSRDIATHCGVEHGRTDTDYLVFADVLHEVNTPGRLGAAYPGLGMFPRQDLEGLGGAPCTVSDEGVTYCRSLNHLTGGTGHEIGHSLGLPHPQGCDSGTAACDMTAQRSLMWAGYANYPATYLNESEKQILLNSAFIR